MLASPTLTTATAMASSNRARRIGENPRRCLIRVARRGRRCPICW